MAEREGAGQVRFRNTQCSNKRGQEKNESTPYDFQNQVGTHRMCLSRSSIVWILISVYTYKSFLSSTLPVFAVSACSSPWFFSLMQSEHDHMIKVAMAGLGVRKSLLLVATACASQQGPLYWSGAQWTAPWLSFSWGVVATGRVVDGGSVMLTLLGEAFAVQQTACLHDFWWHTWKTHNVWCSFFHTFFQDSQKLINQKDVWKFRKPDILERHAQMLASGH